MASIKIVSFQTIKLRSYLTLYQKGRWKQIQMQIHRVCRYRYHKTKRIYQWTQGLILAQN